MRQQRHDPCDPISQDRCPEVLVWEEVKLGKRGPGEARIRHTAVGLNFVDIYNRAGVYPTQWCERQALSSDRTAPKLSCKNPQALIGCEPTNANRMVGSHDESAPFAQRAPRGGQTRSRRADRRRQVRLDVPVAGAAYAGS